MGFSLPLHLHTTHRGRGGQATRLADSRSPDGGKRRQTQADTNRDILISKQGPLVHITRKGKFEQECLKAKKNAARLSQHPHLDAKENRAIKSTL